MHRQSVQSLTFALVDYGSKSATLEVEFHNGRVYQHENVACVIYNGLISASSKGQYFDRMIVKGGYIVLNKIIFT